MKNLTERVKQMLGRDSTNNYTNFEAVAESIVSEIEQTAELTPEQVSDIGETCEEWFLSQE